MTTFFIIGGLILLIGLYVMAKYNGIIKLKNNRENAFADIDVQLKLRFDLIPNIVNTVKGYANHENATLNQVTEARTKYLSSSNIEDKIGANNMLTQALGKLFAVAESYPDLKANTNFLELQRELSDIENKLAASRRFFNSATNEFNTYIESFPANIIAGMFNFKRVESFELENREQERQAPSVQF